MSDKNFSNDTRKQTEQVNICECGQWYTSADTLSEDKQTCNGSGLKCRNKNCLYK